MPASDIAIRFVHGFTKTAIQIIITNCFWQSFRVPVVQASQFLPQAPWHKICPFYWVWKAELTVANNNSDTVKNPPRYCRSFSYERLIPHARLYDWLWIHVFKTWRNPLDKIDWTLHQVWEAFSSSTTRAFVTIMKRPFADLGLRTQKYLEMISLTQAPFFVFYMALFWFCAFCFLNRFSQDVHPFFLHRMPKLGQKLATMTTFAT